MHARVGPLAGDLQRIFATRLQSLVTYAQEQGEEGGIHTLALVDSLTFQDLAACVPLVPSWHRAGFAVPLVLTREEFRRTLDVFPVEYGNIIAHHTVILGRDPFAGMAVGEADLRRACEAQAKSHLIHLREGFLESGGQARTIARMIAASAPALRALLANIDALDPGAASDAGLTPELVGQISSAESTTISEPSALLSRYVQAVERLWQHVDRWRA